LAPKNRTSASLRNFQLKYSEIVEQPRISWTLSGLPQNTESIEAISRVVAVPWSQEVHAMPQNIQCKTSEAGLQQEIDRIDAAQRMMQAINEAIPQGDYSVFRAYRLSASHINQLIARHERGLSPYPPYLFSHNAENLHVLQLQLANLRTQRSLVTPAPARSFYLYSGSDKRLALGG
jgi:hypothetical protein